MAGNYIVSARKYRPKTFDEVVGQEHIATTLKNAIKNDHLAHSFLFTGPRGIGKTSCARILAKTINCSQINENYEACGECSSCKAFQDNNSFAIYELDAASNNGVEHIRELTEQVRFAPQGGKYKVYIIDEVHMLSGAAFNAFLKTLEEPPSYAIFILATTEKHKIIPTILSRCQIFDFKRISSGDIVTHLSEVCQKEEITFEEDALHIIAQKSEGCMRDALSIMDKVANFSNQNISYTSTLEHLNILDFDYYFKLSDSIAMQNVSASILLIDEILQQGFEPENILAGLSEHFRNLIVSRDNEMTNLLDLSESVKQKYFHQANLLPYSVLVNALAISSHTEYQLRTARNKRLPLELCIIKLCHLQQAVQILQEGDELVKKKLINPQSEKIFSLRKKEVEAKIFVEEKVLSQSVEEPQEIPSSEKNKIQQAEQKNTEPKTILAENADGNKGLAALRFARQNMSLQENENNEQPIALNAENIHAPVQAIFDTFRKEKTFFKTFLDATDIVFEDGNIHLYAPGFAQTLINENKMRIKQELDAYFHHDNYMLIVSLKQDVASHEVAQSKREIYEELAQKNQHLLELRDRFGFEIQP